MSAATSTGRPIPRLAGVCGWPIHHSLSPLLHTHWLRAGRVAGAYVPFLVRPDEARGAFASLTRTSIAGVNVTLPLKRDAYLAAERRSADADALGVANTLYVRGGVLHAHNTDLEGFRAPLLEARTAGQLRHVSAVVIGAGGAARAVLGALVGLGVPEIRLLARRDEQARALADELSLPSVHAVRWAERHESLGGAGLIVNASAGGMRGKRELDLKMDAAEAGALAYDLIYTPQQTGFLRAAQGKGLDTVGGLAMLIAQARPAYALFFGAPPPEDADPTRLLEAQLRGG